MKATNGPILIDSDMALDDWMAIRYIAKRPEASILALTVAATGEAHALPGARTADALLRLSGRQGVPIGIGQPAPLSGGKRFPGLVRFLMDHRLFSRLPGVDSGAGFPGAVEILSAALESCSGPATILAIGPLTNLAALLRRKPELKASIGRVVAMGGAVDVPGNVRDMLPLSPCARSEWNFYIDPLAAVELFASGIPITLVPLDATNRVPLSAEFVRKLGERAGDSVAAFLHRGLSLMHSMSRGRGFYFWDPLAAALALEPGLGRYESTRLSVAVEEGSDWGRVYRDPSGRAIDLCVEADAEGVESRLLEALA